MTVPDLIPVALLGGLAGLDMVSFPQAMISRPIVAATLAGAVVGAPGPGLLVGVILEMIALDTLPVGASRYPEWGSASVVGGATYAAHASAPDGALALALIGALIVAWVGGLTMVRLRQRNGTVAARRHAALEAGSRVAVFDLQLGGLAADFIRAVVLSGAAFAALVPLETIALAHWSAADHASRAVVVAAAASVALGATWKLFHATIGSRWFFLGGLALGLLLLGLR